MLVPRTAGSLFLLVVPAFAQVPHARQVSAPPEDILGGVVTLPDPAAAATRSRSALILCDFELRDGEWQFEHGLELNAGEPLAVVPMGTHREEWSLVLGAPSGSWVDLERLVEDGRATRIAGELPGPTGARPADGVRVERIDRAGPWRLRVTAPLRRGDRPPVGRILLSGIGPLRLVSHPSTQRLVADRPVGVAAHLVDPRAADSPLVGVVEEARLTVESAWGRLELAMLDDGRHDDGAAGDGRYGALLPRGLSGDVRALATLVGRTAEGASVELTGQHAFSILEPTVLFTGQAEVRSVGERALELDLGVELLREVAKLQLSAEVWARPAGAAAPVPVAWLGRMVDPGVAPSARDTSPGVGHAVLTLELDARWLGRAGRGAAFESLELRQVRIQDPHNHVVLDLLESLPLDAPRLPRAAFVDPGAVTRDMLMGPTAAAPAPGSDPRGLERRGSLMLVHGYCSGGSVWPAAHYDEPKIEFLDPDQNRSHDEFAQLLLARGAGLPSFGVVAHSQGGAAALHLLTYYTSGLDHARGARRIQTLATPYQGTPLASFGGFACGVNSDLTPAGSATWLAGIPTWAREEVYYWTTVDAGSACSFFANLILDFDDNDGTTERVRGQLPGATNMGHIPGWCHTTGMSFPAGYTDPTRNAQRNAAAAR